MNDRGKTPQASIVIAIDRFRERAESAIRSVLSQEGIEECEFLLFDFGFTEFPPPRGAEHPSVTYLPMRRGMSMGQWKLLAVEMSRGPIVAFVEEHVRVGQGWLKAVIDAHRGPYAGVCGPIRVANAGEGLSDLVTWLNFQRFEPTMTSARTVSVLSGNNTAYKRAILLANRDLIVSTMPAEWIFQQHLVRQGHQLLLDPTIVLYHLSEVALGSTASGMFQYNAMAGYALARGQRSWQDPIGWGLRSVLSPAVRTLKQVARGAREGRSRAVWVLANLPAVLVVNMASSVGLAYGYFMATDDGQRTFFNHEMNTERGR